MKKQKKFNNKYRLLILVVALITLSGIGFLILKNDKNPAQSEDKTTSTAPSAQEDFTGGGDRPVASTPEDKGTASVSDTQGQQSTAPDKSQWSSSSTGEITVYTPSKDKLLVSGDVISGESTLSIINYRIIDNVSGMISQGQLSVVNGKFSGTVSFTTTATGGRLDIYGATDSGKEFGNVEIPVRFR